jgi:hypothetical protein
MIDGGGKATSEGRGAASPSINGPRKIPTEVYTWQVFDCISTRRLPGISLRGGIIDKRSSCVGAVTIAVMV